MAIVVSRVMGCAVQYLLLPLLHPRSPQQQEPLVRRRLPRLQPRRLPVRWPVGRPETRGRVCATIPGSRPVVGVNTCVCVCVWPSPSRETHLSQKLHLAQQRPLLCADLQHVVVRHLQRGAFRHALQHLEVRRHRVPALPLDPVGHELLAQVRPLDLLVLLLQQPQPLLVDVAPLRLDHERLRLKLLVRLRRRVLRLVVLQLLAQLRDRVRHLLPVPRVLVLQRARDLLLRVLDEGLVLLLQRRPRPRLFGPRRAQRKLLQLWVRCGREGPHAENAVAAGGDQRCAVAGHAGVGDAGLQPAVSAHEVSRCWVARWVGGWERCVARCYVHTFVARAAVDVTNFNASVSAG